MPYDDDRAIEDSFSSQIKYILAQHFISKDINQDLEQAQDFGVYRVNPFTVAVRLRGFQYFRKYWNQFTIRWSRPSGVKTEIHKIREGLVNYILYGFLDLEKRSIIQYFIGDFSKFTDPKPYDIRPNNPYDSELAIYELSQFPEDFVIAFWCSPEFVKLRYRATLL